MASASEWLQYAIAFGVYPPESATGTVTSITAGSGLSASPNPITGAGTISLAEIGNNMLLANVTGATGVAQAVGLDASLQFTATPTLALASIAAGSFLANTSGASAIPSATSFPLAAGLGGTGVNNGASTFTIGGAVVFSGAYTFAGTLTANTAVTFPTSGTLATTAQLPTQGIVTINGLTGSATGTTVTFNANSQAGSSTSFTATGSTVSLNVTDGNKNTIIGLSAGNGSITGLQNTGNGFAALHALTSGAGNIAHGYEALFALTSGSGNNALGNLSLSALTTGANNFAGGSGSGINYTGAESSNVLINNAGVNGESNVLRISASGTGARQVSKAFVGGIYNVSPAGTQQVALIGSGDQIGGSTTLPSGIAATNMALTTPNITTGMTLNNGTQLDTYSAGSWTPSWTGLTVVGTPTYAGEYVKIGYFVFCTLQITSTTTTASTAGTTTFTGLPFTPNVSAYSTITGFNLNTNAGLGTGYINGGGATGYAPTWSASANVILSFTYLASTA